MKKLVMAAFISLIAYSSNAQTDPTKVEQYCQVIATPRLLSNKVTIDIDFGEEKHIWNDTRIRTEVGKLRKFNTIIDAMNYMGRSGWTFINAFPVKMGNSEIYHFAFKKPVEKNSLPKE